MGRNIHTVSLASAKFWRLKKICAYLKARFFRAFSPNHKIILQPLESVIEQTIPLKIIFAKNIKFLVK